MLICSTIVRYFRRSDPRTSTPASVAAVIQLTGSPRVGTLTTPGRAIALPAVAREDCDTGIEVAAGAGPTTDRTEAGGRSEVQDHDVVRARRAQLWLVRDEKTVMGSAVSVARAEIDGLPSDRLTARILAHALIEQTQVSPCPDLVDRLTEEARVAGWGEVEVLLLHSRLIRCSLRAAGYEEIRASSDAMLAAAQATGDEILIALALASRALFLVDADHPESTGEDAGGLLARAVAMLEDAADTDPADLGLRAVELPACFVECGQAYHRQSMWELEEEMYVRAADAIKIPLPPAVRPVGGFTRRALVINRLESTTALVSALLEIGRREAARQVAAAAVRPTPEERADLPPGWDADTRALERLLDVVAGNSGVDGGPTAVPADLFEELGTSSWDGYRACLLVAAAVGAQDAGDVASAAWRAEQAVGLLDDRQPSIATLALYLAAQTTRDEAALRYS
jgi:hypothetical protein